MAKGTVARAAAEKIDPTLPYVVVVLRGKEYKFCFTFRAIAKARNMLRRLGVTANLARSIGDIDFDNIVPLAAAALATYQPELSFADVEALVDHDTMADVAQAIQAAFVEAYPKNPLEAAAPASE